MPNNQVRPDINPYRFATALVLQRLRWDLKPQSWKSRRRLRACRGCFAGQKAVIVCNGPSLLKSNLSLLTGVFSFGLNKINLLFNTSDFRPSCVVAVNPFVIEQNCDFFKATEIPLYLNSDALGLIGSRANVTYVHTTMQKKFALDCSMSVFVGNTVSFVAMQLAYHLGFSRVALIGCDHDYAHKGVPNQAAAAKGKDVNHFSPDYFTNGVTWQFPDLLASEMAYTLAKDVFAADGRQIFNATVGGKLTVFPRLTLEEYLAMP